jgi:hypothetical protein
VSSPRNAHLADDRFHHLDDRKRDDRYGDLAMTRYD